uniref:hypothetical protein n=1 Tax=Carboxylicivirga agarovorans TaxID=3417570 RepID=UPI003D34258D
MKRFTMFMIATLLAIGTMVGQQTVGFSVSDGVSPIEGASISFNGETLTSDLNGLVEFSNVNDGVDLPYTVSATGFASVNGLVTVEGARVDVPVITMEPVRSFAFVIYDSSVPAGPMGGNELDGATVELTDGSNTYTATSAMGGFADFADVKFGTYDYTVSMAGYGTVTGTFEVTAETGITVGGPMITLDPVRSFAFVIYDSSVPAGPMGGNELDGATVELTDG